MEDKTLQFECDGCGAEFGVMTEQDMKVEFCCFCSEPLDEIDWEAEEPLDFADTI